MIEVVSAVIIRHDRLLLTQRRPEKDYAFTWECPGGKVEAGEPIDLAMLREIREEIGIGVDVTRMMLSPIWRGEFSGMVQRGDRAHARVTFYRVFIGDEQPRPCEGQGIGWFTAAEMLSLSLSPANAKAAIRIVDCLRGAA